MVHISGSRANLTRTDIDQFSKNHNIELPQTYIAFLLEHNGGKVYPDGFLYDREDTEGSGSAINRFLAIDDDYCDSINHYLEIYDGRIPTSFLPIANDVGGNVICLKLLGTDVGSIYFWEHEGEIELDGEEEPDNLYFIAESIQAFLDKLQYLPDLPEED